MTSAMADEKGPVQEEFTWVAGAATHVLKCGPGKDLWEHGDKAPKVLLLVIPGNPGMVGFYHTFIQALYCGLNQQYPVWAVSHAGHCKVPRGIKIMEGPDFEELDDVFGLQGQIEHKLRFLRKSVPEDVKLVLIGHSIGCYIALGMMQQAPELQVLRSVMLFPTIEHMARTPRGKIMTPILCWLRYVLYVPIYLLTLLPERVKGFLVRLLLNKYEDSIIKTSLDMANMDCVANILYLASQEMRKVMERDSAAVGQHLKKLTFYYGAADGWCPVQYYQEMKTAFPAGDIRLCEKGIDHSFVLEASKEVATMVLDWLQDDLARL